MRWTLQDPNSGKLRLSQKSELLEHRIGLGKSTGASREWSAQVRQSIWEPQADRLALGGGFAGGIAHAGVLKVLGQHHIPIHCVTGVSAGSIVAACVGCSSPD
jgi:hypothetical protein